MRLEDGGYICKVIGSPVYFRCLAHHDGYFDHIDGGGHGQIWAYRLIPRSPTPDPWGLLLLSLARRYPSPRVPPRPGVPPLT